MLIRSLGVDENENSKKKNPFTALIKFIHGSAFTSIMAKFERCYKNAKLPIEKKETDSLQSH